MAYKHQKFNAHGSGGQKSKIKVSIELDEGLIPDTFLLCPHMMERAWELSGSSFINAQISFIKDPLL